MKINFKRVRRINYLPEIITAKHDPNKLKEHSVAKFYDAILKSTMVQSSTTFEYV